MIKQDLWALFKTLAIRYHSILNRKVYKGLLHLKYYHGVNEELQFIWRFNLYNLTWVDFIQEKNCLPDAGLEPALFPLGGERIIRFPNRATIVITV